MYKYTVSVEFYYTLMFLLTVILQYSILFRLNKRDKRTGLDPLLKGSSLIQTVTTSEIPLPEAESRPRQHPKQRHQPIAFIEPDNQQRQHQKRPRKKASAQASATVSDAAPAAPAPSAGMPWMPGVCPPFPQGISGWYGWPPQYMTPGPGSMSQMMPPFLPPRAPYVMQHQQQHTSAQASTVSASSSVNRGSSPSSRQKEWRKHKAAPEDVDRIAS